MVGGNDLKTIGPRFHVGEKRLPASARIDPLTIQTEQTITEARPVGTDKGACGISELDHTPAARRQRQFSATGSDRKQSLWRKWVLGIAVEDQLTGRAEPFDHHRWGNLVLAVPPGIDDDHPFGRWEPKPPVARLAAGGITLLAVGFLTGHTVGLSIADAAH